MVKSIKKALAMIVSVAMVFSLAVTGFAADANPNDYSVNVVGNKIEFVKNAKVVGSFDAKTASIEIKTSAEGELYVRFIRPDGTPLNVTLGTQKALKVDGTLESLTTDKSLATDVTVTVAATGNVAKLTVYSKAPVTVETGAKVAATAAIKDAAVTGVPAASIKTTTVPSTTTGTTGNTTGGGSGGGGGGGSSSGGSSNGSANPGKDTSAPVLKSVTIDGKEYKNGDTVVYQSIPDANDFETIVSTFDENIFISSSAAQPPTEEVLEELVVVMEAKWEGGSYQPFAYFTAKNNTLVFLKPLGDYNLDFNTDKLTFKLPANSIQDIDGNKNAEMTFVLDFEECTPVSTTAALKAAVNNSAVENILVTTSFKLTEDITIDNNQTLLIDLGKQLDLGTSTLTVKENKNIVAIGDVLVSSTGAFKIGQTVLAGKDATVLGITAGTVSVFTNQGGGYTLTINGDAATELKNNVQLNANKDAITVKAGGKLTIGASATLTVDGALMLPAGDNSNAALIISNGGKVEVSPTGTVSLGTTPWFGEGGIEFTGGNIVLSFHDSGAGGRTMTIPATVKATLPAPGLKLGSKDKLIVNGEFMLAEDATGFIGTDGAEDSILEIGSNGKVNFKADGSLATGDAKALTADTYTWTTDKWVGENEAPINEEVTFRSAPVVETPAPDADAEGETPETEVPETETPAPDAVEGETPAPDAVEGETPAPAPDADADAPVEGETPAPAAE